MGTSTAASPARKIIFFINSPFSVNYELKQVHTHLIKDTKSLQSGGVFVIPLHQAVQGPEPSDWLPVGKGQLAAPREQLGHNQSRNRKAEGERTVLLCLGHRGVARAQLFFFKDQVDGQAGRAGDGEFAAQLPRESMQQRHA